MTHKEEVLSTAMTQENAKELQQMMGVVVSQGTGRNAQIPVSRWVARPAQPSRIPSASRSRGSPHLRRWMTRPSP